MKPHQLCVKALLIILWSYKSVFNIIDVCPNYLLKNILKDFILGKDNFFCHFVHCYCKVADISTGALPEKHTGELFWSLGHLTTLVKPRGRSSKTFLQLIPPGRLSSGSESTFVTLSAKKNAGPYRSSDLDPLDFSICSVSESKPSSTSY